MAAKLDKMRGRVQIGEPDPSLTGSGGVIAVTKLIGKLSLIEALDGGIGPVKQRARGFTGGQVLAGMAAAQHERRLGGRVAVPARRLAARHRAAGAPGAPGP